MSYANQQKQRIDNSVTVPYQKVVLAIGGDATRRVCVFEGSSDLPFYGPLLHRYAENRGCSKPIPITGGTRTAVLGARDLLNESYRSAVRYVVDKDHTNYLPGTDVQHQDVFTTRYYSVESYCIGLNRFTKYFGLLFSLEEDSSLIENLIASYRDSFAELIKLLLPLHGMVICAKRQDKRCHMSDVRPSAVFRLVHGSPVLVHGSIEANLEALCNSLSLPPNFSKENIAEIDATARELANSDPLDWLHGKYALSHLSYFLNYWYRHNKDQSDQYGHHPQLGFSLNPTSMMIHAAHVHGDVPELSVFLDQWFQEDTGETG